MEPPRQPPREPPTAHKAVRPSHLPCSATAVTECDTDDNCVAPYDPYDPGEVSGKGAPICVDDCVAVNELQKWCMDNDACCQGLRCRSIDGLCEPSPHATSTGSTTDTGTTGSGSTTGHKRFEYLRGIVDRERHPLGEVTAVVTWADADVKRPSIHDRKSHAQDILHVRPKTRPSPRRAGNPPPAASETRPPSKPSASPAVSRSRKKASKTTARKKSATQRPAAKSQVQSQSPNPSPSPSRNRASQEPRPRPRADEQNRRKKPRAHVNGQPRKHHPHLEPRPKPKPGPKPR